MRFNGEKIDGDRRRYLCGHAARDVHPSNYLRHPPHKTAPIIEKLIDPTQAIEK